MLRRKLFLIFLLVFSRLARHKRALANRQQATNSKQQTNNLDQVQIVTTQLFMGMMYYIIDADDKAGMNDYDGPCIV